MSATGEAASPLILLEEEQGAAIQRSTAAGEVVLFSRRGPDKKINEDGALVFDLGEATIVAVADGMGGLPAGEQAARFALEALAARLALPDAATSTRAALVEGFELANQRVMENAEGAGTTLVAAIVTAETVRTIHAGDSEALLVGQRGRLKHRTVSHSPTGYAVEAGLLCEQDAMVHEERHVLSNAVGMPSMSIEIGPLVPLAARDTLVLATDGLFDNLTADEVADAVRTGHPDAAVTRAGDLAWARMTNADARDDLPRKPDDLTIAVFRPRRR